MAENPSVAGRVRYSLGVWALLCGVASVVGFVMIGQASFEWLPGFDPAGWLRIVTAWMLPLGAIAALILGFMSVVRRSDRTLGVAGIVLAVVALGAFLAMLMANPY